MADVAKDNMPSSIFPAREYPWATSSLPLISSRRDLSKSDFHDVGSQPQNPSSPPSHLTRKRAASLNIDATKELRAEDPASLSASGISTIPVEDKVCLCQPDPKIPRPRNAFILYRQHYQAQVVAHHPGLANPEISKIIGEQWTSQPAEIKNQWKRLAEEEKIRHQRQYPDYRYQPRRAGTASHIRRVSSGESPTRCPKCNGRYILTPKTPSSPLTPNLRSQHDRLLPSFQSPGTPSRNMMADDRAQYSAPPNHTARTAPSHSQVRWRSNPDADAEIHTPRQRPMSVDVDNSPDLKRRRYNNGFHGHHSPSTYDSPQYRSVRPPGSATGYRDGRRSHPPPGPVVYSQRGGMMEPPPRPSPAMHQFSNMSLNSPYDESLRLPPLQTQVNRVGSLNGRMNGHQRVDSQARSVEAMVMTIPYINKIKVLSKISPPLAPPGPTSPVQNIRGTLIAVEGADHRLVAEVGRFIEEYLGKEPECLVKTWPATIENCQGNTTGEVEMTGMDPPSASVNPSTEISPYVSYLSTIQTWHRNSNEIIDFITTLTPTTSSSSPTPPQSPLVPPTTTTSATNTSLPASQQQPSSISTSTSTSSSTPSSAPTSTSTSTSTNTNTDNTTTSSTAAPPSLPPITSNPTATSTTTPKLPIPIALLPTGFSLSLSDIHASTIPIADNYAPVDHWQWMATLWRGIIGPDLTVYVKVLTPNSGGDDELGTGSAGRVLHPHPPPPPGVAGTGHAGHAASGISIAGTSEVNSLAEEEIARYGGVECRWDVGTVIVRVVDPDSRSAGGGLGNEQASGKAQRQARPMIEEKTLRRLGFEVLEWVRGRGVMGDGSKRGVV